MGRVVSLKNDALLEQVNEQIHFASPDEVKAAVSDQRQAANDLKRDVLNRLIIDETDPYFLCSEEGYIAHANSSYRVMAMASGGALGIPFEAGGDGRLTMQVQAVVEEVKSTCEPARYTERLKIDGKEKVFSSKYFPVFNEDQNVVGVVGSFREITREIEKMRKSNESSQRLADFARATSDWFWETDRDLNFKMLSDRFTALTGRPAALIIGSNLNDIGVFRENVQGDLPGIAAIPAHKAFRNQMVEVLDVEGNVLKCHLSGVPVYNHKTGDFEGYRGAGMDVSQYYEQVAEASEIRETLELALKELTRKNIELDRANSSAKAALSAKEEFLASISHELRTPLKAILSFADVLSHEKFGPLPVKYKNTGNSILNAGQYLLGLIEDILDTAIIDTGDVKIDRQAISLNQIIEQAKALSSFKANEVGLKPIDIDLADDITVVADERRTVQILVNLMINAYKFSSSDDRVGIVVRKVSDGTMVAITVWDTGCGISPADQAHVFERFVKTTKAGDLKGANNNGAGLGLHISRELVRLMGGDIKMVSELGKGSAFTVTLPVAAQN